MNDWAGIAWLVVLLMGNAFFVGAEFAVISARRSQIEPLAEQGKRSAITALWAMEHATLMLAACQLGITVCSLLILNVSEPAIHHLLEGPLGLVGIPEAAIGTVGFIVTLLLVSYLHVVFGEMVPKNLSFSLPDRAVLLLAPPLVFVARVFKPLIWTLNAIANAVLRMFKIEPKEEANSTFTLEEVATIVSQSTREGVLVDGSGALLAAFEFTGKKVSAVAVPLADLVTLPEGVSTDGLERAVAKRGYSRYPIVNPEGELTGYLHLKDVLRYDSAEADEVAQRPIPNKRVRQFVSISEDTDLEDALAIMRRSGTHLARAVSYDGTPTGILFLEDIIEELVGEVQDATQRQQGRN